MAKVSTHSDLATNPNQLVFENPLQTVGSLVSTLLQFDQKAKFAVILSFDINGVDTQLYVNRFKEVVLMESEGDEKEELVIFIDGDDSLEHVQSDNETVAAEDSNT